MLPFCDPSSSLSEPWTQEGLSPCFLSTLSSSLTLALIFIFGTAQIIVYRKYSTPLPVFSRPKSRVFHLQILLHILPPMLAISRLILQYNTIEPKSLYGYEVLLTVATVATYPVAVCIILLERRRQLPSVPTWGHGLVLLAFWTVVLLVEALALTSWFSPLWWWKSRSLSTNIALGLWCARMLCALAIFVIGMFAPGLPRRDQMSSGLSVRADDGDEPLLESESTSSEQPSGIQARTGSTWKGMIKKVLMLWPIMWPKKSFLLQLCVITCVLLLVAGRIVNLYTPILYKDIVNSLTVGNVSSVSQEDGRVFAVPGLSFRWDYILYYTLLRFLQGGGF
ncbi:hypothetical protein CAPTEDRAFT_194933, partial [Capitella teleta]